MKKSALIFFFIAFFVFILIAVNSNQADKRVSRRAAERIANRERTTTAPVPVQAVAGTESAPRLNPPHGEPGHICEIPVGAPLPVEPSSQLVAEPRLNPPHGEPGHICEIPVGAPLP